MTSLSKVMLTAAIGTLISVAPLSAQTPDDRARDTTRTYEERRGFDWGWLGLSGLLGLLGLRRGNTYVDRTTTRDYNTGTTR